MKKTLLMIFVVLMIQACATSPMGRKQFILFSDAEMSKMGVASFQKMKTDGKISQNRRTSKYVSCVAQSIINELDPKWRQNQWEVVVFEDDSANAFALPGGKIGVHTGLLKVAKNQDQLATVLGHEVAHVLSQHGNERVSQVMGLQVALAATDAISQERMENQNQQKSLMSLLGIGAQVGVLLPFSRKHETESDLFGLDLMAKAGFDPRQSVPLWENMAAASGGRTPPQFLSTHPNPQNRIVQLQNRMSHAMNLRSEARGSGKNPRCQ